MRIARDHRDTVAGLHAVGRETTGQPVANVVELGVGPVSGTAADRKLARTTHAGAAQQVTQGLTCYINMHGILFTQGDQAASITATASSCSNMPL